MRIICRNCGKLIEGEQDKCPHCSAPIKKKGGSIDLDEEKVEPKTTGKSFSNLEKLLLIGIIAFVGVVILISFFIFHGAGISLGSNETGVVVENNTTQEVENTTANESNTQQEAEQENQTEQETEKRPIEKLKDYLRSHDDDVEKFENQAERIDTVIMDDGTAYVTYTTSKEDYSSESTYLVGATLMAIEEADKADVKGYNKDGMFMNASHKEEKREDYDFGGQYDIWFPNYEPEIECETDADCDDGKSFTKDKCYDGKCSNVEVIE